MKFFLKIIIIFLLLNIFLVCERNDLYKFAKDGIKVIYAFADDGTNVLLIRAHEDYYREYLTSGLSLATIPDLLHITEQNEFIAAKAGTTEAFYLSEIENGNYIWNYYTTPNTIKGVSSRNGNRYVLVNIWNDCIYKYGNGNLESIGLSLLSSLYPPIIISKADSNSKIYIYGKSGGSGSIFDFDNPSVLLGLSTGPGETAYYLSSLDNELYLGTSNYFYSKTAGALNTTTLGGIAKSYAVVNASNIFVSTFNGANMQIMKFEGTDFTAKQTISSTSGTIILNVYNDKIIVAGINNATPTDLNGLYLYYHENNILKKISPRPIYAIEIR